MKVERRTQIVIVGGFNGDIQKISSDPILKLILEQTEEGYQRAKHFSSFGSSSFYRVMQIRRGGVNFCPRLVASKNLIYTSTSELQYRAPT